MTGNGGSSELLQAGIVQKALTKLVNQYPDDPSTKSFHDYVIDSTESVAMFLQNATKDTVYPLDRFSNGNGLIQQSKTNENPNITLALSGLRKSLDLQTRNTNGGLWYYVYPFWSYLDGMFSFAPFYALYTKEVEPQNMTAALTDIKLQMDILWERCLVESSGLLVHGYDFSKTAVWADPETGASPHVWGRSLGWYAMVLVDTIEILSSIKDISVVTDLQNKASSLLSAIAKTVDPATGAWWPVMDRPGDAGNYIESSGSAMFVYSLLKAEKLGIFESRNGQGKHSGPAHPISGIALRAYDYIVDNFLVNNNNGTLGYNGTVSVCSLNSTASYDVSQASCDLPMTKLTTVRYYIHQPILYDSVLGSASFVLASLEVEHLKVKDS